MSRIFRAMTPSLSFVEFLEARLRENAPRQKGARTRERLKIATAKMLDERGYHVMRVTDITQCAEVAEGSFYVYFKDKKDASLTVLEEFLKDFIDLRARPDRVRGTFQEIRMANRRWFPLCRENSGLMRCVHQMGDEDKDFARLMERTNRRWFERMSQSVRPNHCLATDKSMMLAIYCLGSMMDELIRKVIVYPDREFHKLMKSWAADDNAIADAISLIWMRVLGMDVELPQDLPAIAMELAKMMWRQPERGGKPSPAARGKQRPAPRPHLN
jgi:AcrR family transcriptional regulator